MCVCSLGEAELASVRRSAVHTVACVSAGLPPTAPGGMPWRDRLTSADDGLRRGVVCLAARTNAARSPPTARCIGCCTKRMACSSGLIEYVLTVKCALDKKLCS
jgi:hypothetical protein